MQIECKKLKAWLSLSLKLVATWNWF